MFNVIVAKGVAGVCFMFGEAGFVFCVFYLSSIFFYYFKQEEYSVPGEVELGQGVAWLGRLEEESDAAIRGILACAVSNWRRADVIRPGEVKAAVHRVRHALRELALFARSAAVSCRHEPTVVRLAPLVSINTRIKNT